MKCAVILRPESTEFLKHVFGDLIDIAESETGSYGYVLCERIEFSPVGSVVATLPGQRGALHIQPGSVAAIWEGDSEAKLPMGFVRAAAAK